MPAAAIVVIGPGGQPYAVEGGMNEARFRENEERLWTSLGAAPTEVWVEVAHTGTKVRLLVVGNGPPVLFLHGATNAASSWATLAACLPDHRCYLLDRLGCGLSEPIGHRLDQAELAVLADALAVDIFDGLGLDRAALVGTSFGGYFALRAAAAHPARVARVVELSWPFGCPIEKTPLAMRIAGIRTLGKVAASIPPSRVAVRALLRQIGLRGAIDSGRFDEIAIAWYQSLLRDTGTMRNELDAAPRIVHPIRGIEKSTLLSDELLGRIGVPTAFVWGADDPQGGARTAEAFVARIPGATLEVMPDAGHAPWIDDPDHVASVVGAFLAAE